MGLRNDESIWRGKIFTGEWTASGKTMQSTEPGRLRAGMIHINDQTVNDETPAPFGGLGDSGGSSRFGALTNLDEFTLLAVGDRPRHPEPAPHPGAPACASAPERTTVMAAHAEAVPSGQTVSSPGRAG
jgi:benzaldehyde dehydrogenase (NAD)